MSIIKFNTIRFNTLDSNIIPFNGVHKYGSCIGVPPIIPDIPEEPDVPSDPDVDENGYIIFADPEVARICATNWGDGVGISPEQAAAVTDIGTVFKGNVQIKTFNELGKFGVTKLSDAFAECTSLTSVDTQNITSIYRRNGNGPFSNAPIRRIILPKIEDLGTWAMRQSGIEYALLGDRCTNIGSWAFNSCANLRNIILLAETPPSLKSNAIDSNVIIYVRTNEIAEAYKTATNWSSHASRIFPISQLETDNPELYAEIEEYL